MGRSLRSEQFRADQVGIVHVTQRCVRRAFLAGLDEHSGKDYSFRRQWICTRMEALASVFAVDVLNYAILSNHMHQILRNRPDIVAAWSDEDVAIRWLRVFPGRRLEEHLAEPTDQDVRRLVNQPERLAQIRLRLSDISWFMRALSEPIARMANRQDECTGRFWEGRFKAQKIVDEAGLLACAVYVDLNPVRAALAADPAGAQYTSAYDRIQGAQGQLIESAAFNLVPVSTEAAAQAICQTPPAELQRQLQASKRCPTGRQVLRDAWLAPLRLDQQVLSLDPQVHSGGVRASDKGFLHLNLQEYLALLRWTAQQGAGEAAAVPPAPQAAQLAALGIDASRWCELVWNYKKHFGRASCAGSPAAMAEDAQRHGHRWHRGQRTARNFFTAA